VSELARLLPRPRLEHDDVEPLARELLREHTTRGARSDDHEIDGVALAVRPLIHATRFVEAGSA
jgi:hypothetical protein